MASYGTFGNWTKHRDKEDGSVWWVNDDTGATSNVEPGNSDAFLLSQSPTYGQEVAGVNDGGLSYMGLHLNPYNGLVDYGNGLTSQYTRQPTLVYNQDTGQSYVQMPDGTTRRATSADSSLPVLNYSPNQGNAGHGSWLDQQGSELIGDALFAGAGYVGGPVAGILNAAAGPDTTAEGRRQSNMLGYGALAGSIFGSPSTSGSNISDAGNTNYGTTSNLTTTDYGSPDYGTGESGAYGTQNAAYQNGSGTGLNTGTGTNTGTAKSTATGSNTGGLSTENLLKAGGLIASLAAGGQKPSMGTTTTTSSGVSAPWEAQQPYLQALFQQASSLYGQPRSQESLDALRMISDRARAGTSLTEAGQREFGKTIAGDYLRPESNPYLQSTLNNLYGDVQSRVAGTFGTKGGNNYGSSAHQEWLGRALTEAASPILNQNYQTERSRQLNAAQLAPSMAYADITPLQQVGAAKEAYPWDQLAKYQGAVSGNYGGTTNSETTNPYFKANPYLNALGAGLATYGLGRDFGLWGAGNTTNTTPTTGGSYGSYSGSGLNASGATGWGYGWGTQ